VLAGVGIAVCVGVGVGVVVWVAGALYNALHTLHSASLAPRERPLSQRGLTAGDGGLIGVAVVCVGLAIAGRSHFDGLAVGALWVRVLGLAVLVASTVFTLWARFSLGTMWSTAPKVKRDHQLLPLIGPAWRATRLEADEAPSPGPPGRGGRLAAVRRHPDRAGRVDCASPRPAKGNRRKRQRE
jgi:hypothetical protein